MGELLENSKSEWPELVGEGLTSWSDFLAQPEIGLSVREANSLINLSKYIRATGVPARDLNLSNVKFALSKGIPADSMVADMCSLSLKDFKERAHDVVVAKQDNAPRTYTYLVMKRCNETGNLSRVYDVDDTKLADIVKE